MKVLFDTTHHWTVEFIATGSFGWQWPAD